MVGNDFCMVRRHFGKVSNQFHAVHDRFNEAPMRFAPVLNNFISVPSAFRAILRRLRGMQDVCDVAMVNYSCGSGNRTHSGIWSLIAY